MLKHLHIKNFTLIDELNLEFDSGFSVITGETGAGKSIMLGALGLLLGQRADTKTIKTGKDRCVIEAHFDIGKYGMESLFEEKDIDYDAHDCILRREITSAGKSRAFINDIPVPLTLMRQLGERLVDIHSQHQNLLLSQDDFQLNVVDIIADDQEQLSCYQAAFMKYTEICHRVKCLKEEIKRNQENEDFLRFQYHELEEARLTDGEQEELENEYSMLSHAEEIKSALYEADHALSDENSVTELLKSATHAIDSIKGVYPDIAETAERLENSYIELKDIAADITRFTDRVDFDPSRMDEVSNRLDTIYHLQQKFHTQSLGELIDLLKNLAEQIDRIDGSDDLLNELQEQEQQAKTECEQKASVLRKIRQQSAQKVEQEMRRRLVPLGIPHVRFEVRIDDKPLSTDGHDRVVFLFTANSNTPLQPVSQVASGGEIARVMLSLKAMISGAVKLPTIIFDEIDTGVSGKVAEMMAKMMEEMGSADRQVISITHLPQIAARGNAHYKVYKEETSDGTVSRTRRLCDDERIKEIAQMLSGSDISDAAINNAMELLKKK